MVFSWTDLSVGMRPTLGRARRQWRDSRAVFWHAWPIKRGALGLCARAGRLWAPLVGPWALDGTLI